MAAATPAAGIGGLLRRLLESLLLLERPPVVRGSLLERLNDVLRDISDE